MDFTGIEAVTYGVANMEKARKFFADWGLKKVKSGKTATVFATLDGSQVTLRPRGDKSLPKAIQPGSTLREIVWGVKTKAELNALTKRIAEDREVTTGKDGVVRTIDPLGLSVGFCVSKRRKLKVDATTMNAPSSYTRVDEVAPRYDRARPIKIGHAVFAVPNLKEMETFYSKVVGFHISDRYEKGYAVFFRCSAEGDHHNFFLMNSPTGKPGLNHVAFAVKDIHEVFGGGLHIAKQGWKTAVGPGRHPISSAYFWYFENPAGGAAEYFADEDHLTPNWKPKTYKRVQENFAEWTLQEGIEQSKADVKAR